MPKVAKEMTALAVSRLKATGVHQVGGVPGLCLQILPSGGRSWILRASVAGARREMGLGAYPAVSLADARVAAREAREAIRSGADPVADRKAAKRAVLVEESNTLRFA